MLQELWRHTQPVLFVLIGAQVLLSGLSSSALITATLLLVGGTSVRILVTYLCMSASRMPELTVRERGFVCLAWLPKATVQAAIGSVVLDAARALERDGEEEIADAEEAEKVGELCLTPAVLAILVTAPVGAVGIFLAGPRWLDKVQGEGLGEKAEEGLD